MLKKLKSRRSQTEKWPVVTEDELRALGKEISPDHVLGLRTVTKGIVGVGECLLLLLLL